ncbi:hypothetical protein [Puniceibacterium sediminis]|uniref:Uncharacterized protein n=1 Tax=Puniceibacterium sediminis TaxID=1608407 RepID=A0A238VL15_9RHOB|nr:hypothetical protein [Puniceibacterium sediminis]SNR35072.1 hypothetical protein SAMN06265370_102343 [Puniceibacterium sediminis]
MSTKDTLVPLAFSIEQALCVDDSFITATIAVVENAVNKTLIVEAEMSAPGLPPHIENAKWLENQDSALAFVSEHFAEIQKLLAELT